MTDDLNPVYTPATLAKRWECSDRHIRKLIDAGTLPSFKLGGKLLRIRGSDVAEFEGHIGVSDLTPPQVQGVKRSDEEIMLEELIKRARLATLRDKNRQNND